MPSMINSVDKIADSPEILTDTGNFDENLSIFDTLLINIHDSRSSKGAFL